MAKPIRPDILAAIEAVRTELTALIESRLSLAQRVAIDDLTEESVTEEIIAALQMVYIPED